MKSKPFISKGVEIIHYKVDSMHTLMMIATSFSLFFQEIKCISNNHNKYKLKYAKHTLNFFFGIIHILEFDITIFT